MNFFDSPTFTYIILPLLIIAARICDVTLGTIRIIALSRGHRYLAPLLGFFEVLIWITVMTRIMQNLNNPACFVAYAIGFSLGNLAGILVEERLAMGLAVIRIITNKNATQLIEALRKNDYGVTSIPAQGSTGMVQIIFSVIKRSDTDNIVKIVREFDPKAFYSIEEVRYASEGVFPKTQTLTLPNRFLKRNKQGKEP